MPSKSELRDLALRRRDATDPAFRAQASAAIAARAAALIAAGRPRRLAAYVAMRSEADPGAAVAAARAAGAAIALPVIAPGATLIFRRHDPGDALVPGGFGTMVPGEGAPVIDPDAILVPLVGFDRAGTRLGYGKGHYDRTIAGLRGRGHDPLLIGVAFSVQEVETIPHERYDVRLHAVVTEFETLDFRQGTVPR